MALSHRYRGAPTYALDEVSFRVEPGARVGLLGPNGAGKTTLMRIFCGFLRIQHRAGRPPGETRVRVADIDVATESRRAREQVGYLPEQVPLYLELRVREHLNFRSSIKRLPRRGRDAEIHRVAALTGLDGMLETPIGQLSRGYRQRVGIADALLGAPPLVVLDEPTVGLDPNQVQEIRAMLRGLGGAQTLIFSSHILAEVEALCDRVVILSQGRVVADESVADALNHHMLIVEWDAPRPRAEAVVARASAAVAREQAPRPARLTGITGLVRAEIDCADAETADAMAKAIGKASLVEGAMLVRLERGRRRLEERFARVTGASREASDAEPPLAGGAP
ncbi:MAG: ABC transporter ATP-binding protein [Nannocystaceae bacterium]